MPFHIANNHNKATCVTGLRELVGLKAIRKERTQTYPYSPFLSCSLDFGETHNCCSNSPECEGFKKIQNKYQSSIQSLSQSADKSCSAKSPDLQNMNRTMARDILTICKNSTEKCKTTCDTEIDNFKTDFLKCFFVPSFEDEAFNYHTQTCQGQIKKIKEQYNKLINPPGKNTPLSFESVGSDRADCTAPLTALEGNEKRQTQLASQTIQKFV